MTDRMSLPFANCCEKFGKVKKTVFRREIPASAGPCGDTFCYASCDLYGICKPFVAKLCEGCFNRMRK